MVKVKAMLKGMERMARTMEETIVERMEEKTEGVKLHVLEATEKEEMLEAVRKDVQGREAEIQVGLVAETVAEEMVVMELEEARRVEERGEVVM